jgi:hypothetical protein
MYSLESPFSSHKIKIAVLMWIALIILMFGVVQCSRKNQLNSDISKIRKELKKDYAEKIKQRELVINDLRKDNQSKKIEIERMSSKIDSLDKVKKKIQIKYVDRIKEIKIMDLEKIRNYWGGEFNNSKPSIIDFDIDTLVCFTLDESITMAVWNEDRKACFEFREIDSLKIIKLESIKNNQTGIISNLEFEIIQHKETIADKDKIIGICEDENKSLSKQIRKQKMGKFIAIIGGVGAVILAILIVT